MLGELEHSEESRKRITKEVVKDVIRKMRRGGVVGPANLSMGVLG